MYTATATPGDPAAGGALLIILLIFYFLPTIIAVIRQHRNADPIMILNLFLGWTFVAWVLCLAWAVSHTPEEAAERRERQRREEAKREAAEAWERGARSNATWKQKWFGM